MPSKKEIAVKIKNIFSRYLNDSSEHRVCRYVWIEQTDQTPNSDNCACEINDENIDITSPLIGPNSPDGSDKVTNKFLEIKPPEDEIQLSFDGQKEDECVIGYDSAGKLLNAGATDVQESVISDDKTQHVLCVDDYEADGTIHNLLQHFCVTGEDVGEMAETNQNKENIAYESNQEIGDNKQESSLTDELSKYIQFYERRSGDGSSAVDKEIEFIVGNQQASPIVEDTEKSSLENVSVAASNADAVDLILPESLPTNVTCTFDSMYEAVQDPSDPMLFTIRLKTENNNRLIIRDLFTGIQTEHTSVYFQGEEFKPCYIPLRNFLKKRRKKNLFEGQEWFVKKPVIKHDTKNAAKKPGKPKSQQKLTIITKKNSATERKTQKSEANAKKRREISPKPPVPLIPFNTKAKTKREIVVEPPEPLNAIQKPLEDSEKITKAALNASMNLNERKTVSINDWLQKCPQMQPGNNVNMNEFHQGANFPTDIINEAFQLANYIEEPVNKFRDINSTNVTSQLPQLLDDEASSNELMDLSVNKCTTRLPQQLNNVKSFDEPQNLSVKQCPPMSTDFCSERFSLDADSPCHSTNQSQTIHANNIVDNWNAGINERTDNDKNYGKTSSDNWKGIHYYDNRTDENSNVQEDALNLRRNENVCSKAPSTSLQPNAARPQNTETKRKLSTETASPSTKKKRQMAEPIMQLTPEKEKPVTQQHIFEMDWHNDNYSTDLDYEPSETEEDDDDKESSNNDMHRLVIEIPNNSSGTRVVFDASSTDTERSTMLKSTPVNDVEPEPLIRTVPDLSFDLMRPATTETPNALKSQIIFLFNRPCFNFMNGGKCRDQCKFKFNHQLPPARDVFEKLMLFSSDTVNAMYYHFIVKNRMSFVAYFSTLCEVFGRKKMESSFLAAVKHCERHEQLHFYMDIYNGLVSMGWSRFDALTKIVDLCCKSVTAYTVIVKIIVKTDPLYFIELLQKYYRNANIQTHHMLNLLEKIDNETELSQSALTLFVNIFAKYSMSDISDVGQYKFFFYKFKRLAKGDVNLTQRLRYIAMHYNIKKIG